MNYFNERLRAERKRCGLSQEKFAALGGVAKDAQLNYENGSRKPDSDYLAAIAAAGVDVLYLLTGEFASSVLPVDEKELLSGYRDLDIRGKAGVLGMISGMSDPKQPSTAQTFVNHGEVSQQIAGNNTAPQTFYLGSNKNADDKKSKKKLAK